MRARTAIAISVLSITAAGAADLPVGPSSGGHGHYYAGGQPAPMLVVYDDQPGVVVRAYWRAPWRNRHYFPATGRKPKVGRHENLTAAYDTPEPAENYRRSWSNMPNIDVKARPLGDPLPSEKPFQK